MRFNPVQVTGETLRRARGFHHRAMSELGKRGLLLAAGPNRSLGPTNSDIHLLGNMAYASVTCEPTPFESQMTLVKTSKIAGSAPKARRLVEANQSAVVPVPATSRNRKAGKTLGKDKVSERVAAATEELASGLAQASAAAEELRRSMEQIAAGADEAAGASQEQLTAIKQVTANLATARGEADNSRRRTESAQILLAETAAQIGASIQSIERNSERQVSSGVIISELERRAKDVSEITGAVSRISDQTNLLALNAAIEAARAGDHGRGFAVVAEEVRALADVSDKSAVQVQGFAEEIQTMEKIIDRTIVNSRQHYIRFHLPHTYRKLIAEGILNEFSMGYGSINGFRASIASPFYWYDLQKEEKTSLMVYPFCFMDANAYYEQKLTPQQAFDEIRSYHDVIKKIDGTMVTIWHNNFFGSDKTFEGWKQVYELFLEEVVYWDL